MGSWTTARSAIRELEASGDAKAADQAEKLWERYIRGSGGWRLQLNEDSRAYFTHLLEQGEPLVRTENQSQKNLLDAFRFFQTRVRKLAVVPQDRLEAVRRLVTKLQTHLRFVYYQVDDEAEAGLIFEVMNNRGKPLSEADRLKNYLMYLAHKVGLPEDDVKGVAASWGDVFKQVMLSSPSGATSSEAEDRLLRNHWILYKESQLPKEYRGYSISQRVRQEMLLRPVSPSKVAARNRRLGRAALEYTRSLVTTAHDFAEIFNPTAPGAFAWIEDESLRRGVVTDLLSFQRMGHMATATPVLLAARRRLASHPSALHALTTALSVYSFRVYAICNHRAHTGQAHFRRLARDLYEAPKSKVTAVAERLTAEVYEWAASYGGDEEFVSMLRDPNFYESHRPQKIRYLFYEYERELCEGQPPQLDWATFSNSKESQVEHIWARGVQWLGGSWQKHEANVHRLGNLTVTHFNQNLGKKAFADKKRIYRKSNLLIESSLAGQQTWSLTQISRREADLVRFAKKRWPLA